eukprot:9503325-Pyramimonas_sp.AAC.1
MMMMMAMMLMTIMMVVVVLVALYEGRVIIFLSAHARLRELPSGLSQEPPLRLRGPPLRLPRARPAQAGRCRARGPGGGAAT